MLLLAAIVPCQAVERECLPYRQLRCGNLYELPGKHCVVREDAIGALDVRHLQEQAGNARTAATTMFHNYLSSQAHMAAQPADNNTAETHDML